MEVLRQNTESPRQNTESPLMYRACIPTPLVDLAQQLAKTSIASRASRRAARLNEVLGRWPKGCGTRKDP